MNEIVESLNELSPDAWFGIMVLTYLVFWGIKSLILAAKGVDKDDE